MIIKCLTVDDEPLALDIIEDYINKVEFLELEEKCTSALQALQTLKNKHIDLIFLDIQMPDLSGFEMLESLNKSPLIIFTTAYDDYAVDSYNYNAIDYLIKPFSFSRFLKAVDKAHEYLASKKSNIIMPNENKELDYIFINADGNIVKVFLDDILFLKGLSDYIELRAKDKKYIIRDNLKDVEKMLSTSNFARVHKSYIVSIPKIDLIEGNTIKIGNENIPIGRSYRNVLLNIINKKKIG
ncbi:LytR/AlgR family response regulator transcription factor [Bacteroidota bacterium]